MKFLLLSLVMMGCAHKITDEPTAFATIKSAQQKNLSGTITFTETSAGIKVEAHIVGLPANSYQGLHIHEKGLCDGPDYKSAGGHFNPYNHKHGAPGKQSHFGDLGNLMADADGEGKLNLLLTDAKEGDFKKIIGRSVVIHQSADDQKSQPAGDSGARVACGLIIQ